MTTVWLLPSSILNKTPTKLGQKIGYQSGSLWTICLQVCMQTINETMDYLFEFAWSLKTCLIPFAHNSQNWKRCKIKEGKRLFLKPASYSSWSWMLVEAWSLQTTACFQRALIANYKNISFNSASLRNFFLRYSTAVLSLCESHSSAIPSVLWFVPTVTTVQ